MVADSIERVTIKWNHLIDKDSLRIKKFEDVRIEKLVNFFGICSLLDKLRN